LRRLAEHRHKLADYKSSPEAFDNPEKHLYAVYTPPPEFDLTMGQLSEDWNEVAKIASGQRPPAAYALVWLSSLLRFIGTKFVS
jgi:hypothetical protein